MEPLSFLIVDDDIAMLRLMATLLERRGHKVSMYHRGTSASAGLLNQDPDCIITDFHMLGLDGIELTREARDEGHLDGVKIIMVTSQDDVDARVQAENAGVDAFIAKPIDVASFAKLVEQIVAEI